MIQSSNASTTISKLLVLFTFGTLAGNCFSAEQAIDPTGSRPLPSSIKDREHGSRRPTIINRKLEEQKRAAEKTAEETFLHPSLRFLSFLSEYTLKVGDITILEDDVASLLRKHPECRRIQSLATSPSTGKVACRNPAAFNAEGDEVIFSYSRTNELITGATYSFISARRANTFAKQLTSTLQATQPIYVQAFSNVQRVTDSPMLKISVQEGKTGFLVLIDSHHVDRFADSETYAKAKLQTIDFGSLKIGETLFEELPSLPKSCSEVSINPEGLTREFYGLCFGFPYESHIQLEFDKLTRILRAAVLSPIGAATGALVEDALKTRYGLATFCPRITSSVSMGRIKTSRPRSEREKMIRMNKRPASVFAGSCETPIVYTSQMRFIFENRILSHREILDEYRKRKATHEQNMDMQKAFDMRKDSLDGFF